MEILMRRFVISRDALTAVWLLLIAALPAAAQDSFLQQFRRPELLPSAVESSDSTSFPLVSRASHSVPENSLDDFRGSVADADNQFSREVGQSSISAAGLVESACADDVDSGESCQATSECDAPLVRFRKSCFQGAQLNYIYLSDDPETGLAARSIDTYGTFAIPLGSMDHTISFTPYFRADLLQAPVSLDVPDTLYDTGLKMFWRRPINDRLGSMVLFTPSVRSDFTTSEEAFRLFGMALLTWQWVPNRLSLSGGVVYTGREDFPVLPAIGLLWTPTPEWKFDAQFPSPRISRRLTKNGSQNETWAYLSGVFGGNTWAVTRASGASDQLTISDLRLVMGVEYLQAENVGVFAELGYVFNRSVEYTSVPFQKDLDATWMMRTGISF